MAETANIKLHLYRDLSNRLVGELDDGPMAQDAHDRRRAFLGLLDKEPGIAVRDMGVAAATDRPHELADILIEIAKDPTVHLALSGAALYVGKVVAAQIDKALGNAVAKLFDKLLSGFRSKETGDFWIELSDGSEITLTSDATVQITVKGGRMESFNVDASPDN